MRKRLFAACICLCCLGACSSVSASAYEKPRMALVMSKTSYRLGEGVSNSAMGWGAVANLAGIPYDCLFLSELRDTDLSRYQLMVLIQCAYVENELYPGLNDVLQRYLSQGERSVIIDGPFAVFDESKAERDHGRSDALFGMQFEGFHGDSTFRVKVKSNDHYLTSPYEKGQYITQAMTDGLHILGFGDEGEVLLTSGNGVEEYPYLSCRSHGANRTVLVSDFSSRSGVSSFFRNSQPQVFYANLLYELLVRSVHWALYGDADTPFPAPQVSNANMTAIIRLDGDGSQNLEAQKRTIDYLVSIARESGVVAVYGFVSDWAVRANWDSLAPLAWKLEKYGGQIGTHSKTHGVTRNKNWTEELDGSIKDIEGNIKSRGYDIGRVEFFINPGGTIPMEYNGEIAKRFSFYMTHGGEQDIPLGYGNLTWFTDTNKEIAVLSDVPSPDYQWFYDGSWSYTTAQIASFEEAIVDHIYHNVGRGAVFNEMWHDYGITAIPEVEPPRTQQMRESGSRIINRSNIAFYDAMKAKFTALDIYCPGPEDLTNKLKAMAQWDYSWSVQGSTIELKMDLSKVRSKVVANFIGGMGVSIENTHDYLSEVTINGVPHYAFSDREIILPNLIPGINVIRATLSPARPDVPHLTYVSKRMPAIRMTGGTLETTLLTKSKAKFAFRVKRPFILLKADFQEWDRKGDSVLNGYVNSDRTLLLQTEVKSDFYVSRATVPITAFSESSSAISLTTKADETGEGEVWFRSARTPQSVSFMGTSLEVRAKGEDYIVILPAFETTATLEIRF